MQISEQTKKQLESYGMTEDTFKYGYEYFIKNRNLK